MVLRNHIYVCLYSAREVSFLQSNPFLMDKIKSCPTCFVFLNEPHYGHKMGCKRLFMLTLNLTGLQTLAYIYRVYTLQRVDTHMHTLSQTNWVNGPEGLCSLSACCH